MATLYVDPVYC
ncbi:hypothetical protein RDI58_026812 [Solanum bulbocastanum]|uniref:Uncharacterized protein n=1 Tax=Solanum bulbocastanum TaxID=147425 RepID=A0AAN8Y1J0_SOLBU